MTYIARPPVLDCLIILVDSGHSIDQRGSLLGDETRTIQSFPSWSDAMANYAPRRGAADRSWHWHSLAFIVRSSSSLSSSYSSSIGFFRFLKMCFSQKCGMGVGQLSDILIVLFTLAFALWAMAGFCVGNFSCLF